MKTLKDCRHYIHLLPVIAKAGKVGIRPVDLHRQSGIGGAAVGVWLEVQKRPGGMVKEKNHMYSLSAEGKAMLKTLPSPQTFLAPIILSAIRVAGIKGLTPKAVAEKTKLDQYICTAWFRNNQELVDKLNNGRYVVAKPKPSPINPEPPKTVTATESLLPPEPKKLFYQSHKELVNNLIDKQKGGAQLKRNTLKALRTAIHAKQDVSPFYAINGGVMVVRIILCESIVYEIYTTKHIKQLSHKRNHPAGFVS